MFQIVIQFLYHLWKPTTTIGVIMGIVAFLFEGERFKKQLQKPPYNLIAILFVVVICLGGATEYLCTIVPNTIGYTYDTALLSLRNAGLDGELADGNTCGADKTIYSQSIEEGTVVVKNSVDVELSFKDAVKIEENTEKKVSVPNVIGMEQIAATNLLTEKGLQFQVWWADDGDFEYSDTYYIVDQSIPEGSEVPVGTVVRLELSSVQP